MCHFYSQKNNFHVSQTLTYRNGYSLPSRPAFAVGGEPLPHNQLTEEELDELAKTRPTMTYGQPKEPSPKEFVPAHVAFDKKVLLLAFRSHHSTAEHAGLDVSFNTQPHFSCVLYVQLCMCTLYQCMCVCMRPSTQPLALTRMITCVCVFDRTGAV